MGWRWQRPSYVTRDGTEFLPLDEEIVAGSSICDETLGPHWQVGNEWVPQVALEEFVEALQSRRDTAEVLAQDAPEPTSNEEAVTS